MFIVDLILQTFIQINFLISISVVISFSKTCLTRCMGLIEKKPKKLKEKKTYLILEPISVKDEFK